MKPIEDVQEVLFHVPAAVNQAYRGGPIAISYQVAGRPCVFGALSESELAEVLPEARKADPSPVVTADGLAELRERLPVGTRVRCDRYWQRGHGTVVETSDLPNYPHWPTSGPTAWMLSHADTAVCVRFDGDGYSSWWSAKWIERA